VLAPGWQQQSILRSCEHVSHGWLTDLSASPKRDDVWEATSMSSAARGTSSRAKGTINAAVPRLAWTVREFAAAIGINYQTALRMIHSGQVGHFKAGGEYRIPDAEVERLLVS
jgi:excisionase family DNA binding protein